MKIALVCDWFLPRMGGIELHLRDLALALRARGLDAQIVTTTAGDAVVDGVPVHRVPSLRLPAVGVAVSPFLRGALENVLRAEGFQFVHAHASVVSPTAYLGMSAGAALGLPTVVTFHSMLWSSASVLAFADSLIGWAHYPVLTAVSSVVAAQLAHEMPQASIGILPNGVDTAFWAPAAPRVSRPEIHFVTALRMSRKKKPLELVRAFAETQQFVAGEPPLRLTIAGEGPDRETAIRYAHELGISDMLSFPGHLTREQLRDLYAQADVFVLPSERESFGIAALEARAAGLPVIAMLATGARDFIVPGVNGMLARDHEELARFMSRLALEPATRAHMRKHNSRPPTEHDWSAVLDAHLLIYRAAATRRATPPAAAST